MLLFFFTEEKEVSPRSPFPGEPAMIRDVAFGNKRAFLHDLMCVAFKAQATNLHMVCDISSSHTIDDSIKPINMLELF